MNLFGRKIIPLLIALSFLSVSCAEFYGDVQVTNDSSNTSATPTTSWEGNHTFCAFLWGPVPVKTLGGKMETQPDCVIHDIKVTQDFLQVVCSIVTLGCVKPVNIQWQVGTDKPTTGSQTTCYFVWGLLPGDPAANFGTSACGIHDVKVTQDFWQGLCSFATLGLIKPMNIQYKLGALNDGREGPGI
jgi:hypothetical protein